MLRLRLRDRFLERLRDDLLLLLRRRRLRGDLDLLLEREDDDDEDEDDEERLRLLFFGIFFFCNLFQNLQLNLHCIADPRRQLVTRVLLTGV